MLSELFFSMICLELNFSCGFRQHSEHSTRCIQLHVMPRSFLITKLKTVICNCFGKIKSIAPEQNNTECSFNCYQQPSFVTDNISICVFTESECPQMDFPGNSESSPMILPPSLPAFKMASTGLAEGEQIPCLLNLSSRKLRNIGSKCVIGRERVNLAL